MEECDGELGVIKVEKDTSGDYNEGGGLSSSSSSRRPDWSGLPEDVLSLIVYRLNHVVDRIVISGVCRSWRSSLVHLASVSPHINNNPLRYGLPCLAYARESAIHLLDPVNGHTHTFDNLPRRRDTSLEGADQIMFSIDGWLLMSRRHTNGGQRTLSMSFLNLLSKARIELPTLKTTNYGQFAVSDPPTSPSCVVVGFLCSGFVDVEIALCRRGDAEWSIVERPCNIVFWGFLTNPIWFAGSVYGLDGRGNLGVFDPSTETWTVVQRQEDLGKDINRLPDQYLVECDGALLRVCDLGYDSVVFVLRFDALTNTWVQVRDLGDSVLFVGRQVCVSITNSVVRGIKGHVYFNRLCGKDVVINRSVTSAALHRRPTTTIVSTPATGGGSGKLKELLFSSWVDLDYCSYSALALEWTDTNSSMSS